MSLRVAIYEPVTLHPIYFEPDEIFTCVSGGDTKAVVKKVGLYS